MPEPRKRKSSGGRGPPKPPVEHKPAQIFEIPSRVKYQSLMRRALEGKGYTDSKHKEAIVTALKEYADARQALMDYIEKKQMHVLSDPNVKRLSDRILVSSVKFKDTIAKAIAAKHGAKFNDLIIHTETEHIIAEYRALAKAYMEKH